MNQVESRMTRSIFMNRSFFAGIVALIGIGLFAFIVLFLGRHPERAWQAFLINFLFWSSMAQGGLLFSAVMHVTRAQWSRSLTGLGEAFAGFFPISYILFLLLFLGQGHVFPWQHMELGEKKEWLNLWGLFVRDGVGLLLLYTLGFLYLYHAMAFKLNRGNETGSARRLLNRLWHRPVDPIRFRHHTTTFAVLYIIGYAVVLSLIAYDLVMAMDPHWYSTLFGAYHFVKAFYMALGALIILASVLHMSPDVPFALRPSQFLDLGKLFFAFCLVWADFFYCHLVVIWYGNISEETAYVIERTLAAPWRPLAWCVFVIAFAIPFLVLLNRKIKSNPKWMSLLSALVLLGLWLEHTLLIGPAMHPHIHTLPLGIWDGLIFVGFLGLMTLVTASMMHLFPELAESRISGGA
jgi:hypothetical protein